MSIFLDAGAPAPSPGTGLPGSVIGVVTALPQTEPGLPADRARVAIPADSPTSEVVVTVGAGARLGGRVNVVLAADGRASHAAPVEPAPPAVSLAGPGGQEVTLTLAGVSVTDLDGEEVVIPWSDLTYAVEDALTRPKGTGPAVAPPSETDTRDKE
ncbi:hypothetical protein [Actinomyces faecalis]|uniref:hypothetical protein n=1 Tax=Actinomyces faecalis TaxID=2722820 RepID=UPI001556622A|nr:hypothetical protein [Actinomyces faecalis]